MKTYNEIYKDTIRDILENGISNEGMNVRAKYEDGTPAYSTSVFGKVLNYGVSDDNFPFLTLRKVPWKTAIREMLAFWFVQVYDKKSFEDLKIINFWKEWIKEDGTIGKSYAYNHESRPHDDGEYVKVKMLKFDYDKFLTQEELEQTTYGNYQSVKNLSDDDYDILMYWWHDMIHKAIKGTHFIIDKDLLNFEKFLRIVRRCPQFFLAKEQGFKRMKWHMTCDYFCGEHVYDKTTIIFKDTFAKEPHNYIVTNDGCMYRAKLSKNQVVELIKNLKNDPASKRHMVNYFNWENQDDKALVECCYSWHFNVAQSSLNMALTQRSGDVFLGVCSNSYQFYVLQRLLAYETGLEVGQYKHIIMDCHLYSNQIEAAKELLEEEGLPLPRLVINYKDDIFDYIDSDFTLEGELNTKEFKVGVAI